MVSALSQWENRPPLSKGMALIKLPWRSDRCTLLGALVASLLSFCFLFQAIDDLVDDHLGLDLRSLSLLLIAWAALAVALFCVYRFKRGRSLNAVRWSLRQNLRALPALRSPATLFVLTFAVILIVALAAHFGEVNIAMMIDRTDIVVSFLTAIVLATAASLAVRIIIRIAPEFVRFLATLLARLTGAGPLVFTFGAESTAVHCSAVWSPQHFSRPPPLPL